MPELKVGDHAPDFETVNDQNQPVKLSGFRDSYPQIQSKDAIVLGVSPDSAKSHTNFRSKFSLPFPLLVDADHKIADAYGVWQEKSMYGRKYMGIARSHFVIDENGKLIDARYNVKPKDSP